MKRAIDRQASTFTIRTRAKGLLSKLAHDLEIQAARVEGEVDVEGDQWKAELRFPVSSLTVIGAVKSGKVDRAVLSPSDRAEIERRIKEEVMPVDEVVVSAQGSSRRTGTASVDVKKGRQRRPLELQTEDRPGGETVVSGETDLSLRALGLPEVKGPLGAFKVDDVVEVTFVVMLDAP